MQTTYDYLGLDSHPASSYAGFLHIAALEAFRILAVAVNDTSDLPTQALSSSRNVSAAMTSSLWTSLNGGFWRVWQDNIGGGPSVPMSGTLHGQSWATVLGLGLLFPASQVSHYISLACNNSFQLKILLYASYYLFLFRHKCRPG